MPDITPTILDASILNALLDVSPDALITLSQDGIILSWNHGAEALFGYPAEEAIGRPAPDLIAPEGSRDEAQSQFAKAGREGNLAWETVRRRKDGSLVKVQAIIRRLDAAPHADPCLALCERDVTLLKRFQDEALIRAKSTDFLETAPDAMVVVGKDGRIRLVNGQTEKLFGYPRSELIGQTMEILVPPRYRGGHPGHRSGYFADPKPRPMGAGLDLFAIRKDGSEFPAEISLAPVQTAEGTLVTAAIRDITDRKRFEKALAKAKEAAETASREYEAFSYSVAHDLRAPLRGIDGFSKTLLDDYSGALDEDGRRFLKRVRENAQHMGQLIDSLLRLARVSQSELSKAPIDLSAMARTVVNRLRTLQPERQVEVLIADGLLANADVRLLEVVLENLLGNAWKFTGKQQQARIEFGRAREGGEDVYFVKDNGVGFDMAYASKLFGVFQRLHAANQFEGTGIGLATVQRIIHRHGGRIWARSEPDHGAVFNFTLEEGSP